MAKEAKKTQKKKNNKKENEKVLKNKEKNINNSEISKEVDVEVTNEKHNKKDVIKEVKESKKVKKERNNERLNDALKYVDNNRKSIILFVVGFLVATLLFRCILWPDRIATLKDGTQPVANVDGEVITADDLYNDMKSYYSVNGLINMVDELILSKKYPSNDEMEDEIKNTANYYYSMYESNAQLTKQEFLSQYGFASEDDFLDTLRLDYRKNEYYNDYALSLVTDKEVEKYYENDVFGDVDSKHILVSIAKDKEEGLTDEEAKKLAKEIIGKLDNGTSWEDVIKEYGDKIINEELGYNAFNASLESSYLKECKDLKTGTYSKTPVLTSYGYHIVYKIAQKEKPKLDDVKDTIKDILAKEKQNADTNLFNKSLINMRKEANLEFVDTKFRDEYDKYVSQVK